jgi:hypothetical protein
LGHTAGKAHDTALNAAIMRDALEAFDCIRKPGEIVQLDHEWTENDAWKDERTHATDSADTPKDDRIERLDTPQYQTPEDRAAATRLGDGPECVFLD